MRKHTQMNAMDDFVRPGAPVPGWTNFVAVPGRAGQARAAAGESFELELSTLGNEEAIEVGRVQIDCCNKCRGVFLDKGELDAALAAVRGTSIDSVLALAGSVSAQA